MSTASINLTMTKRTTINISRTTILFSLGLVLMSILMIAIFPTYSKSSADFDELVDSLPKGVLEGLGMGSTIDLSQYSNFMNIELLSLIFPITAGIFIIMQGAAVVASEIESGTVSLWLSIPVQRWRLLLGKLVALLLASLVVAGSTAATIGIGSPIVDGDVTLKGTINLGIVLLGFTLAMGGIAVFFSTFSNQRGRAALLAALVMIVGYVLSIAASSAESLDWLRYFSIFTAYKPLEAMTGDSFPLAATLVLYLIAIVASVAALMTFDRRDIVI